MKICPRCKTEYDDTWKVCLKCDVQLLETANTNIYSDNFSKFLKDVGAEFQKINSRLNRIEKTIGIDALESEKARTIESPKEEIGNQQEDIKVKEPLKERSGEDIESTIGLVWLNRIGILALFLGAAFFLKYAFDNRWIGELGRVIIGLLAGFGMIIGSEPARRKNYTVISQGLHGGGVAILYLSIFAAFGFYHFINAIPAFIFMSIVTLYCGFWSTRTDWISSAVIGIVGGFLTPFLVGLDKITSTALFSYVILLDLGIVFMSFYKKWNVLNIGSFFLTYIVYYSWYTTNYNHDLWFLALSFLTAFFGIFCLLAILRNLIYREKSDISDVILVLSNGIAYFLGLFNILQPFVGSLPGLLPISLGCIYIAYSYSALTRCREDRALILSYVGLAVLFATIAIPIQLKHNWVSISWAIEALVLIWLGFGLRYPDIRGIGLGIGILSLVKVLLIDYSYSPYVYASNQFIFNERMFTYLAIVFFIFIAAWMYKKNKNDIMPGEKAVSTCLVLLANFVLLVQFSVEAKTYFAHLASVSAQAQPAVVMGRHSGQWTIFSAEYGKLFSARELSLSLLWVIYAFLIVAVGMIRKFRALRLMGLVLFGVSISKIFLLDLSQLDRAYRIVSFITLGVVLIIASFFYQKYKNEIHDFALKDK